MSTTKPGIKLYSSRGYKIPKGNHTVSYKNNKKKGTATAIIKGKKNCTGSVTVTYKIV